MKRHLKPLAAAAVLACTAALFIFGKEIPSSSTTASEKIKVAGDQPLKVSGTQKIQAAILLDVSNSMDGLIEQAKAQLWNMVSVMGRAKCGVNEVPQIEIALYEYGRSSNDITAGYVKQVSTFTNDLDSLSKALFKLSTNGGDEYCGQVIFTSLNDLKWDNSANSYKVIFIAGNEDFLQGNLHYTKACSLAKSKGVIVNTIYCGDRASGIREHWNLSAECGNGSFTNINSDARIEDIPTPYDTVMFALNDKLNKTYIGYGAMGASKMAMQSEMDQKNYTMSKSAAAKRIAVKSKKELYKNDSWDLVDAASAPNGEEVLKNIPAAQMPAELKGKTAAEVKVYVAQKSTERAAIQKQIDDVSTKRDNFIAEEKKKNAAKNTESTLETAMEKAIKEQAQRFKMEIK